MSAQPLPVVATRQEPQQSELKLVGSGDDAQNRTFTRKERAVLEAITAADLRELTIAEKCERCGVSTRRYYEILADPWFQREHRKAINRSVQEKIQTLVDASAATATTPGRDGFNDRKMLLEMTGHYVPRQQIDHTTAGQPIVGVVGIAMDQV